MKDIINAPVTIIPFDILKIKMLSFLMGVLSDVIRTDDKDVRTIEVLTSKLKAFLACNNNLDIIAIFQKDVDFFDPVISQYYEKDAIMVFVELNGTLYNLYLLQEDEVNSYDVKILK